MAFVCVRSKSFRNTSPYCTLNQLIPRSLFLQPLIRANTYYPIRDDQNQWSAAHLTLTIICTLIPRDFDCQLITLQSTCAHSPALTDDGQMDLQDAPAHLLTFLNRVSEEFHKLPGSAILLRYIKSSYQHDPIRSAVELFLVLFAIRYLLAPKYSTKPNYVTLSEEVG